MKSGGDHCLGTWRGGGGGQVDDRDPASLGALEGQKMQNSFRAGNPFYDSAEDIAPAPVVEFRSPEDRNLTSRVPPRGQNNN